jgi:uncharacterized lipoprotein YddW (UPF0748 family)
MKIKKLSSIAVLLIVQFTVFFSCSREYIKPISVKRNFSGALWIVRHNISTPEKIDQLLDMIKDTDIKHLFVQVRGRGDSYYNSEFEPPAFDVPDGFDPLKYLIEKSGRTDIIIHAWVNVSFVLNAENYPPDSKHILSKHPDWITYDYSGRPMTSYTKKELGLNLAEGYFLDPAIPEVKDYMAEIVNDILSKYDVAGIHLDYIRYPYSGYNSYAKKHLSDFGYNPAAREIFRKKYGIDPVKINRFQDSQEKELFDQFRRDQITEIVKKINEVVKSKDKNIILSAAVMPRYDWGRKVYFQDWPMWLESNLIDIACIMSYSASNTGFNDYINYANGTRNNDRIFMGIMVKKNTGVKNALKQINMSYNHGMRGYSIFSFDHDKEFIEDLNDLIEYKRNVYKY